jgi:hypothetical protein
MLARSYEQEQKMSEVENIHDLVLQRPLLTERILRLATLCMMVFHQIQYLVINVALSRISEVKGVRNF